MGHTADWSQVAGPLAGGRVAHFGDPGRELAAVLNAAVAAPLGHFSLVRFKGSDAQAFLQGQLTCDLREVTPSMAQFGGYCTPKGRLLANFLLLNDTLGYLMHLPMAVAPGIAERLRKFVLRSQVKIDLEPSVRAIGIAGPQSTALLQKAVGMPPRLPLEAVQYPAATLVKLPGNAFLAFVQESRIAALWDLLAPEAVPAGADCWDWVQIRAGTPWIMPATQDRFIPQMVDLDAVGGVSFQKGCYPGQEIVARTHYLGEVPRRLRFGHVGAIAQAGDDLVSAGQARGIILNAAPAPEGGSDLLAVVQVRTDTEVLYLEGAEGTPVHFPALAAPAPG